ncbi:hypothetical protein [Microbacterium oleivorans]|uniref:Uncharacterized protein n=1 Tax=Microbacterium oleivorans TaxID=273677 RepID=A0A7D5EVJ2_9MICO|nr:hypothetical protein [Microbacterium oleivorans]QLD10786.1 hypothetical protein HW566_02705 [Microbacterium oleivorans]
MPFRSRETLEQWIAEFTRTHSGGDLIKVAIQDSSDGEDGGLVIVPLRNASTTIYARPPIPGDPQWRVVFEPQPDEIALSHDEVYALTAELNTAADLCAFFEAKGVDHRETAPPA